MTPPAAARALPRPSTRAGLSARSRDRGNAVGRHLFGGWVMALAVALALVAGDGVSRLAMSAEPPTRFGVVVSDKIKPFIEALEGLKTGLGDGADITVRYLEDYEGKRRPVLAEELRAAAHDRLVAVGPQSLRFIAGDLPELLPRTVFTMVLHPEEVAGPGATAVRGIPLEIPKDVQLTLVAATLPGLSRIGVPHDPAHNAAYVEAARSEGAARGLSIVPMPVASRKDIPGVLDRFWKDIDALWLIPDRTVVTESLVTYVIREALSHEKAVIGFNRLFYENGAVLTFVMDYAAIGQRTAELARRPLAAGRALETPAFHAWLNQGVIRALGIRVVTGTDARVGVGP